VIRPISALGVAALIVCVGAAPATAANAASVSCYGKTPTQLITSVSQLEEFQDEAGNYEIVGTSKDDAIYVDVDLGESGNRLMVSLYRWHASHPTSVGGGTDVVCVNVRNGVDRWQEVSVWGGSKVSVTGSAYVRGYADHTSLYEVNAPQVDLRLDQSTAAKVRVTNETSTRRVFYTGIEGSDKADDIAVTVKGDFPSASVGVDGGAGNDAISVSAPSGANVLVVGGKGEDSISTGSSTDLVYASAVEYSGKSLAPVGSIKTFENAVLGMHNGGMSALPSYVIADGASDTSDNTVSTGGGNDRVYGSNGYDEIRTGSGNDWADGFSHRDRLWGGSGDDTLKGGSGDDDVYGEGDDDTMYGGTDDDLMKGGTGEDKLMGESGKDVLHGNEQDDRVEGGTGNDSILGQSGNDWLRGNDGDDAVDGGTGTDDCTGGAGSDELKGCNP